MEFGDFVATTLCQFFARGGDKRLKFPLDSFTLLRHLVVTATESATQQTRRLRLTDRRAFNSHLRRLAAGWDKGSIILSEELPLKGSYLAGDEQDVNILSLQVRGDTAGRKRKRDEEHPGIQSLDSSAFLVSATTKASLALSSSPSVNQELEEIYTLLQRGTARGKLLAERHMSTSDAFEPICEHTTKKDCIKARLDSGEVSSSRSPYCEKVHFKPLIRPHTDPSLGHCSYLNTCYSEPTYAMSPSIHPLPAIARTSNAALPSGLGAGGKGKEKAPCRYLHFEVDYDEAADAKAQTQIVKPPSKRKLDIGNGPSGPNQSSPPPQWINCDLRKFDASVLGKFHVIMADPPWDIHMSLPYGTMTDDEMKSMPIPALQDEGLLFLWVTGRAMDVGRECMQVWGYTRVDEVVWVKTNQLQRMIRTGRTGHWLNHTKEHMLVGIKTVLDESGNLKWPSWVNRGIDTDVIVSEVRETSRKPDEIYGVIERMCPGGRKIEIFGRKHNTRPGWLTLGNQLGDDCIVDPELAARIEARYPGRSYANQSSPVQSQ
ncbi:MT-A70-domain-containing protein [Cantharellus anzutake]|uniref:MT-A70-domain-containing protein n=1 Tax=Cantharellus anzutake TaxID=1750568 RepID=UPI0019038162|nr:MT-A70-domain-containing protein [Cantharellus anzutake]KAF8341530.1 MT-A70-domain-containing protein [Cantharellus anzutake]